MVSLVSPDDKDLTVVIETMVFALSLGPVKRSVLVGVLVSWCLLFCLENSFGKKG